MQTLKCLLLGRSVFIRSYFFRVKMVNDNLLATEAVIFDQISFCSPHRVSSHDLHQSVKWQPSQLVVLLLPLMTTTEVSSLDDRYRKCTIKSWCYTENLAYKTVSSQGALALHPVAAHVAVQSTVGRLFHITQVICISFQSPQTPLLNQYFIATVETIYMHYTTICTVTTHISCLNGCPSDCFG